MPGFKNELATIIAAWMTRDLNGSVKNYHLIDEPLHQDVAKAIGGRNGIIVHAVAHQRQGGDLGRAFMARLEWRRRRIAQDGLVGGEPLADRLLMAAGAFALAGSTVILEQISLNIVGLKGLDILDHLRTSLMQRMLRQGDQRTDADTGQTESRLFR